MIPPHSFKKSFFLLTFAILLFSSILHSYHTMTDNPTILMLAIQSGDSLTKIQALIDQGENVNDTYYEFLRARKPVLRYALDRKSDLEKIKIIETLLQAGADVNAVTYNRVTDEKLFGMMPLLSYAVIYSSVEVVQLFIDYGADINCTLAKSYLYNNKTPLEYAKELNKEDIVALLEYKYSLSCM